jgi:hypothetical protein
MNTRLYRILLVTLVTSCAGKLRDHHGEGVIQNLAGDTLTLFAEYPDCGEWGGHREIFKIYNKSRNDLWITYTRDTVDCDADVNVRRLTITTSFKLTQQQQEHIVSYIHKMLDENFKETLPPQAGEHYTIFTKDTGLRIENHVSAHQGFAALRQEPMPDRVTPGT